MRSFSVGWLRQHDLYNPNKDNHSYLVLRWHHSAFSPFFTQRYKIVDWDDPVGGRSLSVVDPVTGVGSARYPAAVASGGSESAVIAHATRASRSRPVP